MNRVINLKNVIQHAIFVINIQLKVLVHNIIVNHVQMGIYFHIIILGIVIYLMIWKLRKKKQ